MSVYKHKLEFFKMVWKYSRVICRFMLLRDTCKLSSERWIKITTLPNFKAVTLFKTCKY